MKLEGLLPFRTMLYALCLAALARTVMGFGPVVYCSSENTGLDDPQGWAHYQSWGYCNGNCSGYAFGVLQGHYCWCSNYAPAEQVPVTSCYLGCPGFGYEQCGSPNDGLFGYLALGPPAYGTTGTGASSTPPATSSAPSPTSTSTTPYTTPSPTTQVSATAATIVSTVTQDSHKPEASTTSVPLSSLSAPKSSSYNPPPSSSSSSPSSTKTTKTTRTHTSVPHTSVMVVTKSGDPVTKTVTYTPTSHPSSSISGAPLTGNAHHSSSGLSDGATAGIVIGAIAGIALLALIGFILYRRRRGGPRDGEPGERRPKRTTSVLSRTGLLSRGRQSMIDNHYDEYTGGANTNSMRQSALYGPNSAFAAGAGAGAGAGAAAAGGAFEGRERANTAGASDSYQGGGPVSPIGSSHGDEAGFGGGAGGFGGAAGGVGGVSGGDARRSSKPLVYDQRLNPSVLFANHDNGSRVSMQDNNDYSRPLGIANPDPRPSFESRRSHWD